MSDRCKIIKKMGMQKVSVKSPPHRGFINELARLAGCHRETVSRAIYHNARGAKAEKVRQLYKAKYEDRH